MTGDGRRDRRETVVRERAGTSGSSLVHEEWRERFPWLAQGTTTRGSGSREPDFGLFSGGSPRDAVEESWSGLLSATGFRSAVHAQQVHGAEVRVHREVPSGLHMVAPCDGHVTSTSGVLVAVTVADCVPVFVVAPEPKAVAVLHAGWRGVAAGVLEEGLATLCDAFGAVRGGLHVHLGPSICGSCYEVGQEVFAALSLPVPDAPRPIDLRRVLAARAMDVGISPTRISISAHCTRCTGSRLYSHRNGDEGRQVGYLGIRP